MWIDTPFPYSKQVDLQPGGYVSRKCGGKGCADVDLIRRVRGDGTKAAFGQ
jgi:hypothetical protein